MPKSTPRATAHKIPFPIRPVDYAGQLQALERVDQLLSLLMVTAAGRPVIGRKSRAELEELQMRVRAAWATVHAAQRPGWPGSFV